MNDYIRLQLNKIDIAEEKIRLAKSLMRKQIYVSEIKLAPNIKNREFKVSNCTYETLKTILDSWALLATPVNAIGKDSGIAAKIIVHYSPICNHYAKLHTSYGIFDFSLAEPFKYVRAGIWDKKNNIWKSVFELDQREAVDVRGGGYYMQPTGVWGIQDYHNSSSYSIYPRKNFNKKTLLQYLKLAFDEKDRRNSTQTT